MSADADRVVIVGAGVAGLTLASRLAQQGRAVTVLERETAVGGLARSYRYGDFTFDVGPHRFHTYDPAASQFIGDVLGTDRIDIGRASAVWMFERYLEWPLNARALAAVPPRVILGMLKDLLRRPAATGERFSDHIRARYGETLYRVFFKPYTERLVKLSCDELSREWAQTGIERALIDRGIKANSLVELARSSLARRPAMSFVYPASGGVGVFAEKLAARVRAAGGTVSTGVGVSGLRVEAGRVRAVVAGAEEHRCETLVWTGPVTELMSLLGGPAVGLRYLSLLLFNYEVEEPPRLPFQWCYFSDETVPFARVSMPVRFNPRLAPPGQSGVCVEVTARLGDAQWACPEDLDAPIREALCRVGLVTRRDRIRRVHIERVPNAWPLYTLGFRAEQARALEFVSRFPNVRLLGRNALFWYNNADHSISAALQFREAR